MYWINGISGLLLALAPFLFGYSDNAVARSISVVLGSSVLITLLVKDTDENKGQWEYWVIALVGLCAIVAPFMLHFNTVTTAMVMNVGTGLLLVLASGAKLYCDQRSFRSLASR